MEAQEKDANKATLKKSKKIRQMLDGGICLKKIGVVLMSINTYQSRGRNYEFMVIDQYYGGVTIFANKIGEQSI
ncbi:hypothetical protein [Companilactobacillus furfuricola]|uniref:hypothetical protein n=1 Tax=Companilactobacillus furfuricola TaxID=1462575 RepID=UPI0013DDE2DC|nr:hypothetical protein [Companilactobacillus furfuricola]